MKEDLVSIIIPVYKAEVFLQETIKTIQNQTYKNWEAIFINDCSPDKSVSIIKNQINKDNRIKLINLEKNFGVATARNIGIDNAQGQYIAFLDADDLWKLDKLEKQIKFIKDKNCAFSFTGYEFANANGVGNGKVVSVPKKLNYKQALKNTTIWTSTVMIDIKKLDKEVIKMPNIKRGQDTATWWKILKIIDNAYGKNEVLSYYRRTNGSLSSNKIKALNRTWNLYRNVENLNIFYSIYNFSWYVFNAILRRV